MDENGENISCGGDIKRCAKVAFIIEMTGSLITFFWFIYVLVEGLSNSDSDSDSDSDSIYTVIRCGVLLYCLVMFGMSVLGLIGVTKERPGFLIPAMIIMAITLVLAGLLLGLSILAIIGTGNPAVLILGGISLIVFAFNLWAFMLISRTRRLLWGPTYYSNQRP